jgi:putative Holliday junction resolvase
MHKKERILSIDYGLKNVGVAYTDEFHLSINYLPNLLNNDRLIDEILKIIKLYNIDLILVGYPNFKVNFESKFKEQLDKFYILLKEKNNLNVIKVDESNTTEESYILINKLQIKKNKKKQMKDPISAGLILKNYLDKI